MTQNNSSEIIPISPNKLIRKTYYGNSQSDHNAKLICERYGLGDLSDAIRFALELVASSETEVVMQVRKRAYRKAG